VWHNDDGVNTGEFMQLNRNVDAWPHLKELLQSYRADWVKDEFKYGHYDSLPAPVFEHQIFEGPDTDVETGLYCENFLTAEHNVGDKGVKKTDKS